MKDKQPLSNVFVINAHQPYPFSEGRLNKTLTERAVQLLQEKGHSVRTVTMLDEIDVEQQLDNHTWADVVLLQSPVNWMGMPWSFKKYMDEVYSAGMQGALCQGDGRTSNAPKANYGAGGTLTGKKYMLSLTFNAPEEAFDDANEYLFQGKGIDDLMFPMHMNFRFFAMTALPTFACFDVMKSPDIEKDLARFDAHIQAHI